METVKKLVVDSEKLLKQLQAEQLLHLPQQALAFALENKFRIAIASEKLQSDSKSFVSLKKGLNLDESICEIGIVNPAELNNELPLFADEVILLIDASQAWTRTESIFYKNIVAAGTPIAVILVNLMNIDNEEQEDIIEYVEKKLESSSLFLTIDEFQKCAENSLRILKEFTLSNIAGTQRENCRKNLIGLYFRQLLQLVQPQIEKLRQKENRENQKKDAFITDAKNKLDSDIIFWKMLNREFQNSRRDLERKIISEFEKNSVKSGLIRSAENASSIEEWWRTRFQNELNSKLKEYGNECCEYVGRKLKEDLIYIGKKVEVNFHCKIDFQDVSNFSDSTENVGESKYGMNFENKTVLRLAILGVSFLATSLIGLPQLGIIIPNIAGEFIFKKKEESAKEKAVVEIKKIVDGAVCVLREKVISLIREVYEKNFQILEQEMEKWRDQKQKNIEKLKSVPANEAVISLRQKCEQLFNEILTTINSF